MLTIRSKELRRSVNKLSNEVRVLSNIKTARWHPTNFIQRMLDPSIHPFIHFKSNRPVCRQLLEPYQSTELRTHQLRRIHAANDLLKKVSRFSATLARLRKGPLQGLTAEAAVGTGAVGALKGMDPRELAKAAAHLHELEGLVQVRS